MRYIIDEQLLPNAIRKYIEVEQDIIDNHKSVTQACKDHKFDRHSYYKYKDCIINYTDRTDYLEYIASLELKLKEAQEELETFRRCVGGVGYPREQ